MDNNKLQNRHIRQATNQVKFLKQSIEEEQADIKDLKAKIKAHGVKLKNLNYELATAAEYLEDLEKAKLD